MNDKKEKDYIEGINCETDGKKSEEKKQSRHLSIRDIALIGAMVAVIEVCKMVMAPLPNIELTSFWVILFTLFFGWKMVFVIPVFILIEGCVYGFGLWWIMYLYAWPLLALFAYINRKKETLLFWSLTSATFGLLFGAMCAIPYFFLGWVDGGIAAGLRTAFAWWVAGIPWDITHAIGNFVLMLVLFRPMRRIMEKIRY